MVDAPELAGQIAIVTGGARAIGRAIAETLAGRGATVVSVDLASSDETVGALPEPVGPVTSTRPRGSRQIFFRIGGRKSSSIDLMLIGMTRSMARELGPSGIAVNGVAPGLVTTEITTQTVSDEYRDLVAKGQCLQVPILPADIAGAVAYLCSPSARMVTGQTLLVNGGATMGPA